MALKTVFEFPIRFREEYLKLTQFQTAVAVGVDIRTVKTWEKASCFGEISIDAKVMARLLILRKILDEKPNYRYGDMKALRKIIDKNFEVPVEENK